MALAYPEGECFFRRSALKSDHKDYYQADRPDHFYGHFLVEFIWNLPAYTGEEARKKRTHPRSTFKLHDYSQYGFMSSRQGPYIGNWSWMSFTYCAHPYKGKQRRVQHNLCTNRNRLQSQVGGDPMETYFMIIPMPKRKENWVFIDNWYFRPQRTARIRGIYIPVAQQSSEDHPELCTFLHVNLAAADTTIKMLCHGGSKTKPENIWKDVHLKKTTGLPDSDTLSLGVNVCGLVNLLSLPRQLRAQNVFTSKNLIMLDSNMINTVPVEQTIWDGADFDWIKVAGANFGMSIQWKPAPQEQDWLGNFLKNSLTVAVGFIPGIGPIAAIAFPLMWTAVTDPDSFVDTMRALLPAVDLELKLLEAIRDNAKDSRQYLPDGWENSALGPRFLAPRPPARAAAAALTSTVKPEEDIDYEELINNELRALVGQSLDAISQPLDAGRPEKDVVLLESEVDAPSNTESRRLEDVLDANLAPDQVTLDELGPSMSFRLTEQVMKATAKPKEESEWEKLVKAAQELASKLPHLPGPGNKKEEEVEEEDITKVEGPHNNYNWANEYLRELFTGSADMEE